MAFIMAHDLALNWHLDARLQPLRLGLVVFRIVDVNMEEKRVSDALCDVEAVYLRFRLDALLARPGIASSRGSRDSSQTTSPL